MKTKAVRMYGTRDLRLEEFELPEIKDDEILAKIITDSICMSTYKLVEQGKKHKRAPQNMDTHPIITGHEFAGVIVKVGKKWQDQFKPGMRFAQQPALNYKGSLASPGYSYEFFGGDCTYCIFPHEVMELGALMPYDGDSFFEASLGEPMSCIIGGYHANYHTNKHNYNHAMGTKEGGNNDDLIEANNLAAKGIIDPAVMITHVGGIDSIAETTLNLPKIPGGKKLAYTQFDMPMTAIEDFAKLGKKDPFFYDLDKCCKAHNGLWNAEAEKMILKHFNVEI